MFEASPVGADPALSLSGAAPHTVPPRLEILSVERKNVAGTPVLDFVFDQPLAGGMIDGRILELSGWVLGRSEPAAGLGVFQAGVDVYHGRTDLRREDVLQANPGAAQAPCGFRLQVAVLGGGRPVVYDVVARVAGIRVPLARITVQATPLPSGPPVLQPLLVTTLGRSGSTLLMELLAHHPQIAAYSPRLFEARVASYWTTVLATLAQPASFLQGIAPTDIADPDWWLGRRALPPDVALPDPRMMTRLAAEGVDATLGFCLGRIEWFYRQVAALGGLDAPRYFAEKFTPEAASALLWDLYPRTRELVLVRDFRDMVCSILAFNTKRGYDAFGRQEGQTPADYVRDLRPSLERLVGTIERRPAAPCIVRYEDLVLQPHPTLAALLRYVGLESDQATVEAVFAQAAEVLPTVQQYHATSKDPAASIGRWKTEFDDDLRAAARETLDPFLAYFGYEKTA